MLDKGVTRRSPGVHTSNDVDKTVVPGRLPYLPHLFIICLCLPALITYFNLLLRLYSTALYITVLYMYVSKHLPTSDFTPDRIAFPDA